MADRLAAGTGAREMKRFSDVRVAVKNKDLKWAELITTILKEDGKPTGLQIVFVDMTEIKKATEERKGLAGRLQRAERMESLGQIAGGIAHGLNNALGATVGYAELMAAKMPDDSPLKKLVLGIISSSRKATSILHNMLTMTGDCVAIIFATGYLSAF